MPSEIAPPRLYADVAVPLPLNHPLTYEVPAAFQAQALPGARARVRVGRRRLVGVVLDRREQPPEGVTTVRPLESVIDPQPVVTPDLIELARFVADYYLAPIGEVLRSMIPQGLSPWGDRRVWLTDQGALAAPRSVGEAAVVEALSESGRTTIAELQARVGLDDLEERLRKMAAAGRIALAETRGRGLRYAAAYELGSGELAALLERCGRSLPGRQAVEYLSSLGRPATGDEIQGAVGCGPGVVRRLAGLGVLRRFSQIERLGLDHHVVSSGTAKAIQLRPDQAAAAGAIIAALETKAYASFLLAGITGSGKTEVYLRAAAAALAAGRSAILMVPEIALVPALAGTLRERFGRQLAILHSALSGPERQQEWERIRRGEARVVLGPRSAIFAPVVAPGLLVVDEEQDASYKQDSTPRYNGRDVALMRARQAEAVAVLVSATPSLETRLNVERAKIGELRLTERVGQGELPEGILVDLRKEGGGVRRPGEIRFSGRLLEEIRRALDADEQVILLRNRRGYSPVLLCRACGEDLRCESCGLPRTYHKRSGAMLCHYCGSHLQAPERCGSCGEAALEPVGSGTERVEEQFREFFPDAAVATLDRDAVRHKGSVAAVLERFRDGGTQVLIGTQMVTKGHHFPRVSLTAVLQADTYLSFPDFRSVERTYNLLTQLAGRAGRGDVAGRVVIQTFHPEHYAIRAALDHDDRAFAAEEMRFRRVFHYPPYTRMVQLLLKDSNRNRGLAAIEKIAGRLDQLAQGGRVRILGPAPAPFERLRDKWRFQLLLRGPSGRELKNLVAEAVPPTRGGELVVDVDPLELL